jgi:hypothetical protein
MRGVAGPMSELVRPTTLMTAVRFTALIYQSGRGRSRFFE